MRIKFASGSLVETIVTFVAAALMTFAGLAMVEDSAMAPAGTAAVAARVVAPPASG